MSEFDKNDTVIETGDAPGGRRDTPLPGTNTRNISTEHQEKGGARNPGDTLDRDPAKVHPARDFDFANDAGNAEPGGGAEPVGKD